MSDTTVNRLLFDGHCWKKYRERHVHEEILAFARENGLDAHRDGEHRTFVDFGVSAQSEYLDFLRANLGGASDGIRGRGICFETDEVTGAGSTRLSGTEVMHGMDGGHPLLIYELFFRLKKFFIALHVDDSLGLWSETVWQHEPVRIPFRELTEEEKSLGGHLDLAGSPKPWQIFLGIIELFLWDKGKQDAVLCDWETMVRKIRRRGMRELPVWLFGIVETWIWWSCDFCKKPVRDWPEESRRVSAALGDVSQALAYNLLKFGCHSGTKLGRALTALFEYEDAKSRRDTGRGLADTFEGSLRYALSALEFAGFSLSAMPNFPAERLEIGKFGYYA